ncbi:unnamed protein product, partial [Ectocarpus sp. 6 AP-2014]
MNRLPYGLLSDQCTHARFANTHNTWFWPAHGTRHSAGVYQVGTSCYLQLVPNLRRSVPSNSS